jgi:hypothetical protein
MLRRLSERAGLRMVLIFAVVGGVDLFLLFAASTAVATLHHGGCSA